MPAHLAIIAPAASAAPIQADQDEQARRHRIFRELLLSPSETTPLATRRDAAVELLGIGDDAAVATVQEAIASGETDQMLAVIEAISAFEPLPNAHLDGLVAALPTASDDIREPLCLVLARYGDSATFALAPIAMDPELDEQVRLNAIEALGSIHRQSSAARLMELLDPTRREHGVITDAVCDALSKLTGRPFGRRPLRWRNWWSDARDLPPDAWHEILVESLTGRVAELDRRLRAEQTKTSRAVSRQLESLNELFPLLNIETQLERLPVLLESEHEPERMFALERVGRLLRDSITIPEDLQDRLTKRLGDPSPVVRRRVIALLDELGHPDTGALIAAILPTETETTVLADALRTLARHESPQAYDELVRLLQDPDVSLLSASAIAAILEDYTPTDTQTLSTLGALSPLYESTRAPAYALLLAWIGDDVNIDELEPALDEEDDAVREAVADGFARRGLRRPLLDRAEVPTLYPYAVRVIATDEGTIANLETLLELTPPEDQREVWQQGLTRLLRAVTPAEALSFDDVLRSFASVPATVRIDLLSRTLLSNEEGVSADDRLEASYRTIVLQLDAGNAGDAWQMLTELNGAAGVRFVELRFRTAIMTARFDEAAELNDIPSAWIRELTTLVDRHVDDARALGDEISRRFGEQLADQDLVDYNAAISRLPMPPATELSVAPEDEEPPDG